MDAAKPDYSKVLIRSILFHGTAWPDLQDLMNLATVVKIEADQPVIQENELVTGLYVILDGSVEIVKLGQAQLALLEVGNFFGEISLFGQSICATASVIAGKNCQLMVFPREMLNIWLKTHPESEAGFFRNLATELCNRLHSTTEKFILGHPAKKV